MINQYFDKKQGKAIAFSYLSNGIGAMVLAPLIQILTKEYGYTGTFTIIGACTLHYCVANKHRKMEETKIYIEEMVDLKSGETAANQKGMECQTEKLKAGFHNFDVYVEDHVISRLRKYRKTCFDYFGLILFQNVTFMIY